MSARPAAERPFLDRWSGTGLVVANMIGTGVLLSAGFMVQDMNAGPMLLAWVTGAALALCGAKAYGALAAVSGRSGGEYRYLSDFLHPLLGYLAGWGSLLLGFAAPVAVDAHAIGAYANTLGLAVEPRLLGAALIVALTAAHAFDLRSSRWTQNALVVVKVALLLGFVGAGLALGSHAWPSWVAPNAGRAFPVRAFVENQFWIAFAFSGWNAAIYAASEFERPRRDVPFAMLCGCAAVSALYLLVNVVFALNLTPEQATVVFHDDAAKVTLGHAVAQQWLGPAGGGLMSGVVILTLVSAISAMTLTGPRVYAAMANDGYLPRWFGMRDGHPPKGSIALQGVIALVLLFTHSLLDAVQQAAAILMVFTGLTVLSLFAVRFTRPELPRPDAASLVAALVYACAVTGILYLGFRDKPHLLSPVAVVGALAGFAYLASRRTSPAPT